MLIVVSAELAPCYTALRFADRGAGAVPMRLPALLQIHNSSAPGAGRRGI
jgi:hypothetical protein